MFNLAEEISEYEQAIGMIVDNDIEDPLDKELSYVGNNPDISTAFEVMKSVMDSFRDFCEKVEMAWKIQELPATLRQRLITIDNNNQILYQKLYLMIQKYAEEMRDSKLKEVPEWLNNQP